MQRAEGGGALSFLSAYFTTALQSSRDVVHYSKPDALLPLMVR